MPALEYVATGQWLLAVLVAAACVGIVDLLSSLVNAIRHRHDEDGDL